MAKVRAHFLHFCGPKCSICCSALSVWGIIMLGILGVLLYVKSAAFIDDITLEPEHKGGNLTSQDIIDGYHASALNCWLAAVVYVVVFLISIIQVYFNMKKA